MTHSLTKNHLVINFLLLFFLLALTVKVESADRTSATNVKKRPSAEYEYQLKFDARYGNHYYGNSNVATHRHTIEYEQKAEFNNIWSAVLGGRAETEAAYASLPERYGNGEVTKRDSQSFFLRDNYLQYQDGAFRGRAGFQQVVWGEAFTNYSDIVNPKDLREAGLGDLSRNRLSSLLVNLQWIFSNSSLQFIYIPKATYSLLPSTGSDFNSFSLPAAFSGITATMPREPDSPLTRGEYGLRLNKEFSGLDLTLFYLNYYDHSPVYQIQFTGPTNIALMPVYNLLQTGGVTATVDLGGYLIRSEIISNMERTFNTFDGVSLAEVKLNETIYVLGLDLPPIDKWLIAFQYSHSAVADGFKNASASNNLFARTQKQSVSSVRISKTFKGDIEMETQLTHFNEDSSQLMQAQIKLPISNRSEVLLGLDKFDGNENSSLGRFKKASRVWVMFQVALKE